MMQSWSREYCDQWLSYTGKLMAGIISCQTGLLSANWTHKYRLYIVFFKDFDLCDAIHAGEWLSYIGKLKAGIISCQASLLANCTHK